MHKDTKYTVQKYLGHKYANYSTKIIFFWANGACGCRLILLTCICLYIHLLIILCIAHTFCWGRQFPRGCHCDLIDEYTHQHHATNCRYHDLVNHSLHTSIIIMSSVQMLPHKINVSFLHYFRIYFTSPPHTHMTLYTHACSDVV